jgi:predicted alpha/beta hydrolase family esterase
VRAERFQSGLIAGALLVAPADPARFGIERAVPQVPLLFPTTLVASANDPWMSLENARLWAENWGSTFVPLGHAGHINAQSGLGDWPAGLDELRWLCRRMRLPVSASRSFTVPSRRRQRRTKSAVPGTREAQSSPLYRFHD